MSDFEDYLIKEIEDARRYALEIIESSPDGNPLYTTGKQVTAQMILNKLNKIKLERP